MFGAGDCDCCQSVRCVVFLFRKCVCFVCLFVRTVLQKNITLSSLTERKKEKKTWWWPFLCFFTSWDDSTVFCGGFLRYRTNRLDERRTDGLTDRPQILCVMTYSTVRTAHRRSTTHIVQSECSKTNTYLIRFWIPFCLCLSFPSLPMLIVFSNSYKNFLLVQ